MHPKQKRVGYITLKNMLPLLLLSLGFSFYLNGFHAFVHSFNTFSPLKFKSQFSGRRISYAHFSSLTPSERDLQKYYLLRENKRPEVFGTSFFYFLFLSTNLYRQHYHSQSLVPRVSMKLLLNSGVLFC